ncbi:hypothetical protein [Mycolicibacterium komossense]|uniref:Intersectin-EH binding protein Ibp1 n=1 Tax=Mycolicibacterium komossense TaxID=1779 RepID=A0ABT3CKL3_9MYCO|nr:hypothetical protein [Mycolicibacterium komossense]MCV7229976.1 hypothetical protein [Mycolicibacterium komossense]
MVSRLGTYRLVTAGCCAALMVAMSPTTLPVAAAQGCPPGHQINVYSGQCYVEGSAPTVNGIPCVASHLGTCTAFSQNQQPPRRPLATVAS